MDLSILEWVSAIRTPFLNNLLYFITNLGSEEFYMLVLTVIFWCISKPFGYSLAQIVVLSDFINTGLKDAFKIPRPDGKWPGKFEVLHAETGGGYGFPSGHAQGSTTFWAFLATGVKRSWFTIVATVIFLAIGFSRIYLAVHSPSDVLVGTLTGLLVVVLFQWLRGLWVTRVKLAFKWNMVLAVAFPLVILVLNFSTSGFKSAGLLLGILVGGLLEDRYVRFDTRAPLAAQAVKIAIGLAGVFALRIGLKPVLTAIIPEVGLLAVTVSTVGAEEHATLASALGGMLRYVAIGIYTVYVAPLLFRAFKLSRAEAAPRVTSVGA